MESINCGANPTIIGANNWMPISGFTPWHICSVLTAHDVIPSAQAAPGRTQFCGSNSSRNVVICGKFQRTTNPTTWIMTNGMTPL